ncbi:hypothetical protein EVAR_36966_1 [Eumeta japonica]|uniref:Uncharacterized protein n=1 Tax=Eumeta variegata TaxID=151549 RepID=A0A4C1W7U0_EUMVA|nr:hypothetical protein EVAR_36966_1 [Eumeta japonica]
MVIIKTLVPDIATVSTKTVVSVSQLSLGQHGGLKVGVAESEIRNNCRKIFTTLLRTLLFTRRLSQRNRHKLTFAPRNATNVNSCRKKIMSDCLRAPQRDTNRGLGRRYGVTEAARAVPLCGLK